MSKFAEKLAFAIMFAGALLLILPFGTLMGGIAGWVVGVIFGDQILSVLSKLGLHGVTMWQLGLTAGFFGAFLRTNVSEKK